MIYISSKILFGSVTSSSRTSSSKIFMFVKEFLAMLLRRLPIPERYTSEATINAFGFFIAKKEVFSPLPNPISRIIFS